MYLRSVGSVKVGNEGVRGATRRATRATATRCRDVEHHVAGTGSRISSLSSTPGSTLHVPSSKITWMTRCQCAGGGVSGGEQNDSVPHFNGGAQFNGAAGWHANSDEHETRQNINELPVATV